MILRCLRGYVKTVDAMNRRLGRLAMYSIFLMMAVLLYSIISKAFFNPSLITLELSQFLMVGYFLLGGAYSIQLGDHVRMDLLYGKYTQRTKTLIDIVTVFFLLLYLGVLLYGGINSTLYSLEHGERAPSAWRPYLWPIKIIMVIGILSMLLQAISELIKDIMVIKTPQNTGGNDEL